MPPLSDIYRVRLGLLTDLYQLTMANGYWKTGLGERFAAFHLTFREPPFGSGFTLACGLEAVVEYLEAFRFEAEDLAYLEAMPGNDGRPLFARGFLEYLSRLRFTCDVDAVPEGTVVFPHEPLVRVVGPLAQAQLVETALLNLVNFPTLVATKAARLVSVTGDEPVLEFGLRRAQGIDGALTASRAAYIGGCAGTSNVLAGRLFGIPVRGTHAHSWVMCFDDELEAFLAYAEAMPNNCIFLVDTYDTLAGVRHAIEAGRRLRERGHEMIGIRLDSGDLAYLSIEARRMLDEAGFPEAAIVASNDLDEHLVASLKQQGARIGVWGVGTKLVTAFDQPALGGVYKLSAVRDEGGRWRHRIKLSEQAAKVSNPGILQVRRFFRDGEPAGDVLYDVDAPIPDPWVMIDPLDPTRRKFLPADARSEDLLVPVFRGGKRVYDVPPLAAVRRRAADGLASFHSSVKRLLNPHEYPVGLEAELFDRRTRLVLQARGHTA